MLKPSGAIRHLFPRLSPRGFFQASETANEGQAARCGFGPPAAPGLIAHGTGEGGQRKYLNITLLVRKARSQGAGLGSPRGEPS